MKILVVDDEASLRFAVSNALLKIGEISEAESGERALELIKRNNFDLVISDLRMPGMNGVELIRKSKLLSNAKFIIISGSVDDDIRTELIGLSVLSVFEKPFRKDLLLKSIETWVSAHTKQKAI